eukprot:3161209-Pyramimonas_sp.AAC.1
MISLSSLSTCLSGTPPGLAGPTQSSGWMSPVRLMAGTSKVSVRGGGKFPEVARLHGVAPSGPADPLRPQE